MLHTHNCPGPRCPARVHDSILACPLCWAALSPATKRKVVATRNMSILAKPRREALEAALNEWRAAA